MEIVALGPALTTLPVASWPGMKGRVAMSLPISFHTKRAMSDPQMATCENKKRHPCKALKGGKIGLKTPLILYIYDVTQGLEIG
jgi:hypothetical protein